MPQPLNAEELERLARKRAGAKLGWYTHALVYIVFNVFFLLMSNYGWGHRPWSFKPMLGWGVGLVLHGIAVFVIGPGGGLREYLVERERERLRRDQQRFRP